MKKIHTLMLILPLSLSLELVAQDVNSPQATVKISQSSPPSLLNYLFSTYGIEASEQILLKVQDYEMANDVKVLYKDKYLEQIKRIEAALGTTKSIEEFERLDKSRNRIINFSEIEHIVTSR